MSEFLDGNDIKVDNTEAKEAEIKATSEALPALNAKNEAPTQVEVDQTGEAIPEKYE